MMLKPRIWPRPVQSASVHPFCSRPFRSQRYATLVEASTAAEPPLPPPSSLATFIPPPIRDEAGQHAIRSYKPRTPGVRHLRRPINDHLWKGRPHLALTIPRKGQGIGGRNNTGQVTVRHRGGGHKRRIRTVDFARMDPGKHTVERIEHDPGRSAHIALLSNNATSKKSYVVAAEGMRAGDVVESYRSGIPQDLMDSMGGTVDPGMLAARTAWRGNCLPLHMIPIGTLVYNVGTAKNRGAVFCRSAGTHATVISKDESEEQGADGKRPKAPKYVTVKLQSGEVRKVSRDACATVGVASNGNHQHRQLGKAGRKRWLGIRPTVRGLAMNACEWILFLLFNVSLTSLPLRRSSSWWRSWKVKGKRAPRQSVGHAGTLSAICLLFP